MSYEYAIGASSFKSVRIGIGTPDMIQASALSNMGVSEINEILIQLNAVITGQLDYLDWGTDLFYVSSEIATSRYGDYDKAEQTQVPTISLRNFLIELKNFKEQCLEGSYYKTIVSQAFTEIKANPSQYKRWYTSDIDYLITLNNITITLVLEADDFNLSVGQYVAQLKNGFQ